MKFRSVLCFVFFSGLLGQWKMRTWDYIGSLLLLYRFSYRRLICLMCYILFCMLTVNYFRHMPELSSSHDIQLLFLFVLYEIQYYVIFLYFLLNQGFPRLLICLLVENKIIKHKLAFDDLSLHLLLAVCINERYLLVLILAEQFFLSAIVFGISIYSVWGDGLKMHS